MKNKKVKIVYISEDYRDQLISLYSCASGTTIAVQNQMPHFFFRTELKPRNELNPLLGYVITASGDETRVEVAYDDPKEGKPNGDMFIIPKHEEPVIIGYYRGIYGKLNPEFEFAHKGNKDYLRNAITLVTISSYTSLPAIYPGPIDFN